MTRPFTRVPRADAQPGKCLRCSRKDDLFDLGNTPSKELGFGVAYLCSHCMTDLLSAMGVVQRATHKASLDAHAVEIESLKQQLLAAHKRANLPLNNIRSLLERFSHGVDGLARDLVRDLDVAAAGSGTVPGGAAHEDEHRGDPVPDVAAGEERGADEGAERASEGHDAGDSRRLILERLGLVGGNHGAAPRDDEGSDVWELLERERADEDGEGDDDTPRE